MSLTTQGGGGGRVRRGGEGEGEGTRDIAQKHSA